MTYLAGSRRALKQNLPWSQMESLAPRILKAVTPQQHAVDYLDLTKAVPNRKYDIVGVSYTTEHANISNRLADGYRSLGIKTVAGGPHPTMMTNEALEHFDVVVKGAGELVWPKVLDDFLSGDLTRVYKGEQPSSIPFADRGKYPRSWSIFDSIEVSRGCPNVCGDFCSVPYLYGGGMYYQRPLEEALLEIETLGKHILFCDNNLVGDVDFARELFGRMAVYEKRWIGAVTLKTIKENPDLAPLLRQSGCDIVFAGLETLVEGGLTGSKDATIYREAIKRLHGEGIAVEGSFVVGLACDTKGSLDAIPEFVDDTKLELVCLNILTPFPGTGLFNRLERKGKILTRDWSLYDTEHVVFIPDNFTPDELQECYDRLFRQVFSLSSIFNRNFPGETPLSRFAGAQNLVSRISFELSAALRQ